MKNFIALTIVLLFSQISYASSFYCIVNPKDCVPIQGALIPFDDAESINFNCERLLRNNIGARAMTTSFEKIMQDTNKNTSHPLMQAHLAYESLHDSHLKFDRTLTISPRYPQVRQACQQVFQVMR